jgi:hypothetical protein
MKTDSSRPTNKLLRLVPQRSGLIKDLDDIELAPVIQPPSQRRSGGLSELVVNGCGRRLVP